MRLVTKKYLMGNNTYKSSGNHAATMEGREMIITKKYAKRLVREGKAKLEDGQVTDQARWQERYMGKVYQIVTRYDLQRTDHYEV